MCGRLLLEAKTNQARKSLPFLSAVFMDHCRAPSNDRGTRKKSTPLSSFLPEIQILIILNLLFCTWYHKTKPPKKQIERAFYQNSSNVNACPLHMSGVAEYCSQK